MQRYDESPSISLRSSLKRNSFINTTRLFAFGATSFGMLGIPVKANADSGRKSNGVPERSDADVMIVPEVIGIVFGARSFACTHETMSGSSKVFPPVCGVPCIDGFCRPDYPYAQLWQTS